MTGIFMHALIGIDADGARFGKAAGAIRLEPFPDQIVRESLTQPQLHGLGQKSLQDIQHQQAAGDDREDGQLNEKTMQIAPRKGVVKGLVPAIEPYLGISRGDDDKKNSKS